MAKWLAGMFGRYFSSHKGGIFASPSVPQRGNWKRPCASRHCATPSENSSGIREHVVGAEGDARAVRVGRAGLQAGVGQGQQGGGHAHLALPAHHLEPLADGLLRLLLQRAEIVDLAAELPGLGAEADGQIRVPVCGQRERGDAAAARHERIPQRFRRAAQRTDHAHAR